MFDFDVLTLGFRRHFDSFFFIFDVDWENFVSILFCLLSVICLVSGMFSTGNFSLFVSCHVFVWFFV